MADVSQNLPEILRAAIRAHGPIPFREFMAQALYHPQFGYYSSGRARIGRRGDFFTNVSVGPLFGRLLARQFAEIWRRLGKPSEFAIVEQGAHRGEFPVDALTGLREFDPACFAVVKYRIVEPSAASRTAQNLQLGALAEKVSWVESVAELPPFGGVHFSNELIDAFPVHLVKWNGTAWLERCVGFSGENFHFVDSAIANSALAAHLARLSPPASAGYQTEVTLAAPAWIAELAPKLTRGVVLAIDYGFSRAEYYRPERTAGTLSAYADHRREPDPLARPGEHDLTAHVEFTSLVEAAERAGLQLAGFTDQHHFMVALGQLHFPGLSAPSPHELRAFKTLMHPTLLGQNFKALALSKDLPGSPPLTAFSLARPPRAALGIE